MDAHYKELFLVCKSFFKKFQQAGFSRGRSPKNRPRESGEIVKMKADQTTAGGLRAVRNFNQQFRGDPRKMSTAGFLLKCAQSIIPLTTMTKLSARLTDAEMGGFNQFLIKCFIKQFHINLEECADPDPMHYKTFNEFFTRRLKDGARPVAENCAAVCPADGTLGSAGPITQGRLLQAKGIDYSLLSLLGGYKGDAQLFAGGFYSTIYLSPSNYHRIHMPVEGTLIKTVHIPGRHFPVGRRNISHMPDLYTKNERLVCIFDTDRGPFAVIFVGAALVGSIATVWGGTIKRSRNIEVTYFGRGTPAPCFKKGEEIGLFKYGSTIITLWHDLDNPPSSLQAPGQSVQMGQPLTEPWRQDKLH